MKIRTNEELKAFSEEHLYYEIWMLNETSRLFDSNTVKNNAIIESFGIHARVLLDFLYKTTGLPDDTLAVDFFDDPTEWKKNIEEKSEVLDNLKTRVGKEIAHLTYKRLEVTPEEKDWDRPQIGEEINEIFKKFLELVSEDKICDKLKKVYSSSL